MLVMLSHAACQHIAYLCNERAWRDTGVLTQTDAEEMRLLFVRAAMGHPAPLMFDFSREQIRAIDMLLTDADPREGKLPDGTPILALVEAIWRVMTGDDHADEDDHQDPVTRADAGTPVRQS